MLILQNISYSHPNKNLLFGNISFRVNNHDKIVIIGNNGSGKSTLLKLIAKELHPSDGQLTSNSTLYLLFCFSFFHQHFLITLASNTALTKIQSAITMPSHVH